MEKQSVLVILVCLGFLLYGAWDDLKTGKINSTYVLAGVGIGIIYGLVCIGQIGVTSYLVRLACLVIIFFIYEGFLGGGDAKLLMLVTIWAGPKRALFTLGAGLALLLIVQAIQNREKVFGIFRDSVAAVLTKTVKSLFQLPDSLKTKVKFVPYMLAGYVLSLIIAGI